MEKDLEASLNVMKGKNSAETETRDDSDNDELPFTEVYYILF
jgi:hypothetical protein